MQPAFEELDHRRPVWKALSEQFLDTELDESDLRYIAGRLAMSKYSPDELEFILRHEVGPVVGSNSWSMVGVWSGFNTDWLEKEILKRQRGWRRWVPRYSWYGAVRQDWKRVRKFLNEARYEQNLRSFVDMKGNVAATATPNDRK